jgi:hypothetical protein
MTRPLVTNENEQATTSISGDERRQEFELGAETVKDLEPDTERADAVRGGPCWKSYGGGTTR